MDNISSRKDSIKEVLKFAETCYGQDIFANQEITNYSNLMPEKLSWLCIPTNLAQHSENFYDKIVHNIKNKDVEMKEIHDEVLDSAGLKGIESEDGVMEIVTKEKPVEKKKAPKKTKVNTVKKEKQEEEVKPNKSKENALKSYKSYCEYMKVGELVKHPVEEWQPKDFVVYFYCALAKIKQENLTLPAWGKDGKTFQRLLERYSKEHLKKIIFTFAKRFQDIVKTNSSINPDISVLTTDWKVSAIELFMQKDNSGVEKTVSDAYIKQKEKEANAEALSSINKDENVKELAEKYRSILKGD